MVIRVKHIVYLIILILVVRHFSPLDSIATQNYNVGQRIYNNSQEEIWIGVPEKAVPQQVQSQQEAPPITLNVGVNQTVDNSKPIEVQRYIDAMNNQQSTVSQTKSSTSTNPNVSYNTPYSSTTSTIDYNVQKTSSNENEASKWNRVKDVAIGTAIVAATVGVCVLGIILSDDDDDKKSHKKHDRKHGDKHHRKHR